MSSNENKTKTFTYKLPGLRSLINYRPTLTPTSDSADITSPYMSDDGALSVAFRLSLSHDGREVYSNILEADLIIGRTLLVRDCGFHGDIFCGKTSS